MRPVAAPSDRQPVRRPWTAVAGVRGARTVSVAAALALVLLVIAPEAAHACAVCFDPRSENRFAFLATTAFLSLLPLGMVAGAGAWIRHRVREIDAEAAEQERGEAPGSPTEG